MASSDDSPSKDSDVDDMVTGVQLFYKKLEREIRSKNPQASFADVASKVDHDWRNLSRDEQQKYKDQASMRNKKLIEKETSHLTSAPDVVTIDDSEDDQDDDIVWDDGPGGKTKSRHVPEAKRCVRLGCPNNSKLNPEWDEEFCSEGCAVRHVKQIYNRWRENRISNSKFN